MLKVLGRRLYATLSAFGFDGLHFLRAIRGLPLFASGLRRYRALGSARFPALLSELKPMLADRFEQSGTGSGHYFHQDLWAARLIFGRRPVRHLDIGSRIDGFVAHLLTFMPVEVIDIRPLGSVIPGLLFVRSDATNLADISSNSVESLSSLHAIEHFGLGRYGDTVNPDAWILALHSIERVLRPGGFLYLSVPIGRERLEFDAHRVFSPSTIVAALPGLRLTAFAAVSDEGSFHPNAHPEDFGRSSFSCGLFEFTKA